LIGIELRQVCRRIGLRVRGDRFVDARVDLLADAGIETVAECAEDRDHG
jgi:hypothetical protein